MIRHIFGSLLKYLKTPPARSAEEFGDEIEEEIAFHLASSTYEFSNGGMTMAEARRAAVEKFGDPARVAALCHAGSLGGLAAWHRLHLALTLVLSVCVGLLWFQTTFRDDVRLAQLPPGIASMLDNDWTGDVQGRILDDSGVPIANAHVLVVVKTWPDESYFQRAYLAMSSADGQFHIDDVYPVNEVYEVQVAALADYRTLQSSYYPNCRGALDPLEFKLSTSSDFELIVKSEQGSALAGVEVLLHGRVAKGGEQHTVYFDSAQPIMRITDATGHVALPYFKPGDTATVMVRVPDGQWKSYDVVVPTTGATATIRATAQGEPHTEES